MCGGKDETLVAAYGPNEDATVAEKGQFFNQLQKTIDEYRGNVMIMGDLNGRVESNHAACSNDWKSITGKGRDDEKMERTFHGILEETDTAPEKESLVTLDTVPELFSEEDLDTALKEDKDQKRAGNDHISPEMVKYL
ncbi:hypothetical protein ILUMI_12511 [Ignelater luminosus]|uniref:Uncharacterized protein n=1 Tax=Ignelater luminosus TaxID=2038154 RepID=A0A8K0GC86_IGNLU|nr:hypothetical protein ILUMI_12511 [Ignelater luminosus]